MTLLLNLAEFLLQVALFSPDFITLVNFSSTLDTQKQQHDRLLLVHAAQCSMGSLR